VSWSSFKSPPRHGCFFLSHATSASFNQPLLRNLLVFGRLLRRMGVKVTSGGLIELVHSMGWIDIQRKEDFRDAARCILVSRHDDLALFEQAFELFWRAWVAATDESPLDDLLAQLDRPQNAPGQMSRSQPKDDGKVANRSRIQRELTAAVPEDEAEEGDETITTVYSPGEAFRQKDFSSFTPGELSDAKRFLGEMRWEITRRRSLRLGPSPRGRRLDVRRSVRGSLRHGGEILVLSRRGPKMKRRPIVVLCDISGSMDRYSRLLLHFLHSVERSKERVEVFVFSTGLTRITRELRKRDADAAVAAAAGSVQDWSGGTRIGEVMQTFNQHWARRVMGQGAIVMVISDGWDRGDPVLLSREMERLQRQSYRLLWLNPLLGSQGYQPLTQGIQAVLPYVDDFLPIHNLASLQSLAGVLNDVQEGRPARKRAPRALIDLAVPA
jgi:uncharacterized protein with von Willebrand factor type A (vWA) domain